MHFSRWHGVMERAVMTVEGTAAQRESLKTLHFAATSRLIWILLVRERPVGPPDLLTTTPRRNRISSFLTSETVKKQKQNTSPLLPWRINTWGHNQRHCFIMFGRVSRHIFCRICNVFFSARSSVLSQQITKAPKKHSPCFYNSAPQPRRWMSLGLSSVRNTCLLFH